MINVRNEMKALIEKLGEDTNHITDLMVTYNSWNNSVRVELTKTFEVTVAKEVGEGE